MPNRKLSRKEREFYIELLQNTTDDGSTFKWNDHETVYTIKMTPSECLFEWDKDGSHHSLGESYDYLIDHFYSMHTFLNGMTFNEWKSFIKLPPPKIDINELL